MHPSPTWTVLEGPPRRWRLTDGDTLWEIRERPWNAQFFPGCHDIYRDGERLNLFPMLCAAQDFVRDKIAKEMA